MPKQFLRRDAKKHSKFGKRRKKKLKWKRPTGRDNKMREKRKGRPKVVSIGYRKDKKVRGTIQGKIPIIVKNIRELEAIKKNQLVIIGAVGKKKKLEIAKKAKVKGIEIHNLNTEKFLKRTEKKKEKVSKVKIENKQAPKGVPPSTKKKDLSEEGKENKELSNKKSANESEQEKTKK